ncbi:peptide deformylase [Kitasatospora griseola]|uniref:peptide deformylase n=1 Tax=Kitasatospora griseola TaxID=2064 RepID=UPI0016711581|nr:peptide deformylase [Kitasatospora griseola]GGR00998.1 hypothetical protein GCM10010195_66070 [Kitasatospora griseola]
MSRSSDSDSPAPSAVALPTVDRAAALVLPPNPDAAPIILLNPRVADASEESDEQYEGCLSFFDVRGLVPRPLRMDVTSASIDGRVTTVVYELGLARLVAHEIDHRNGLLYTDRMRDDATPIPVEKYRARGPPGPTDLLRFHDPRVCGEQEN